MRTALARAAANIAMRAAEPRNRFARWTARWFDRTPIVPADRFQDSNEPAPGHWRTPPDPWPTTDPAAPQAQAAVAEALRKLPPTWRDVIIARDIQGRDAAEVGNRLGLMPDQQRAILSRARAAVRTHLDQQVRGNDR